MRGRGEIGSKMTAKHLRRLFGSIAIAGLTTASQNLPERRMHAS